MPKHYCCIVCEKQVPPKRRMPLKGGKNGTLRENLSVLLGRRVGENDCICGKCYIRNYKGQLKRNSKSENSGENVQATAFYLGTKSNRYCAICGMKKKQRCRISQECRSNFFLKHNILFYDNARSCPSHLSGNSIKKSEFQKYSFRLTRRSFPMSNNALLQQLSKCRELLLKKECIRIDFDNPDFLNDEDYINLTGISRDQFNTICT